MGTTGATLHCRVQSLAEAQQFAESLRSEFSRIEPGSGWFRGQVEWLVAGGRNTLEFPAKGRFDEGLWQFADGPLPESASARRIVAHEIDRDDQPTADGNDRGSVEYTSTDLIRTAGAADPTRAPT